MGTTEPAAEAETTDDLLVYSDYVCPFCYLGRASLDRYRKGRDEPLTTDWHPFDLRGYKRDDDGEIQADVDDGKDEDYFAQVRENVDRLAAEYDVEIELDAVPDVDSWDAQQAALFVREEHPDSFEAFHETLYEAYWSDHRDIGDEEVLVEVAESVDVDGASVTSALESDEWTERLETAFDEARQFGITGVPTFVADGHAARGAVPPEQLRRLLEGSE